MISLLCNIELQQFPFYRFLLIDRINILIKIFQRTHIFVLDFGLNYDKNENLQEPDSFDQDGCA